MTRLQAVGAAVIALVGTIVLAANGIGIVHWTDVQVGLVLVNAEAGAALVIALIAHVNPATKREPVAIGTTVIALATASFATASGFQWWDLTEAQNGLLISVVTSAVALAALIFARQAVVARAAPPIDV